MSPVPDKCTSKSGHSNYLWWNTTSSSKVEISDGPLKSTPCDHSIVNLLLRFREAPVDFQTIPLFFEISLDVCWVNKTNKQAIKYNLQFRGLHFPDGPFITPSVTLLQNWASKKKMRIILIDFLRTTSLQLQINRDPDAFYNLNYGLILIVGLNSVKHSLQQ